MTVGLAQEREPLIGSDLSFRDWVKQTRESNTTVFSDGFERQGLYRIFISYPVFDRLSGEYIATIGASISLILFFLTIKILNTLRKDFWFHITRTEICYIMG